MSEIFEGRQMDENRNCGEWKCCSAGSEAPEAAGRTEAGMNSGAASPDPAELAEFYKHFADSTRVRILSLLCEREMCVCDIVSEMGMTQSAVSHQLNQLRRSRLVRARREGRAIYYSLDDSHVLDILACGIRHLTE